MTVVKLEETVFVIKQNENFREFKTFDCQRMVKVYFGFVSVLLADSFNFNATLGREGSLVEKWLHDPHFLKIHSLLIKIFDVRMLQKEQTFQCKLNLKPRGVATGRVPEAVICRKDIELLLQEFSKQFSNPDSNGILSMV